MQRDTRNWEQITDRLLDDFSKNIYQKDEKMPSENDLSVQFSVPRTEVRRAYNRLKELGYIYSVRGCGSFYSGRCEKIKLSITDASSFSEKMLLLGVNYTSKNLGLRKITNPSTLFEQMGISSSENLYEITRLRCIDNNPVAIHVSYVSKSNFPEIEQDGPGISSIFRYIRQCGYKNFYHTNSEVVVSTLTPKERKLLHIQGYAPCLILNSQCINQDNGQILELARTIYKSDSFIFKL